MDDGNDTEDENRPSSVRITVIVQNRYTFASGTVTGKADQGKSQHPSWFLSLPSHARRERAVPDDLLVELRNGDHLFARPL